MQDHTPPAATGRWVTRIGTVIAPDENPSAVIYGLLTTGALLAAESTRQETLAEAIGASVLTLVLYWLAHAYSSALGSRLESGDRWTANRLFRTAVHEAALLKGAAVPLIVLVATGLTGSGPTDSVLAALVATAIMLLSLELIAGVRARLRGFALGAQVVVAAGLGVGVILLKVAIH
jgi:hypothetical protein